MDGTVDEDTSSSWLQNNTIPSRNNEPEKLDSVDDSDVNNKLGLPYNTEMKKLLLQAFEPQLKKGRRPSTEQSETTGSWFIRSLCEVLSDTGTKHDLLTLLTLVCRSVAFKYKVTIPSENIYNCKQMPYIITMLTRLVKFE
ncbi:hypothetical protein DBV15_11332 [Temnothorax longispinosus]|uniref:Caspase family p10 domain-containing protein n=1 Tax=Temnothorax longispinosus TaxID=300112 RepID=A0A4S2KXF3_9HYME|nr:hypothetical protein DBV15_11332 [Temnothorax longispinosus]